MTLPVLTANYKKKVTSVRLKHFSSLWHQVSQRAYIDNGDYGYYSSLEALSSDSAYEFFNTYLSQYLTVTDVKKKGNGVIVGLPNGSGFYFFRSHGNYDGSSATYLVFCTFYKYCKQADWSSPSPGEYLADGKNTFTFYLSGEAPMFNWDGSREWLIQKCKTIKGYCTTLIENDGWEIKNDYPYAF